MRTSFRSPAPRPFLAIALGLCLACGASRAPESPVSQQAPAPSGPRVLIIGLDGADWEILDRLERDGRIPHLSRLRREGAAGVMRAEEPLLSPVIWTSLATGRTPAEHGILGFLTVRNGITEPVRSDERQVRAFWNIASDAGLKVGIIGWYSTWPAEKVNGFLVSDRAGHHQMEGAAAPARSGVAYPAELEEEVASLRRRLDKEIGPAQAGSFLPEGLASEGLSRMTAEQRDTFLNTLRTTELHRRLAPGLLRRYQPEVAAVYFEGTDSIGHLFGQHAPPLLPGIDPGEARLWGGIWDGYYAQIDRIVGELVALVDPRRCSVAVVSDHGFKTGERRPIGPTITAAGNQAPLWHRPEGILLLWGRGIKPHTRLNDQRAYDLVPTLFRLLGLPLAATLAGRPAEEALTAEILASPPGGVVDYEARGERERAVPGELPALEELARLKALGYIGDSPAAGGPAREGQAGVPLNRYNKGLILLNAGRLPEALEVFSALRRDHPGDPLGNIGVGLVLLRQGRAGEAVAPLEEALKRHPGFAPALAYLAEAHLRTGNTGRAAALLDQTLERDPGHGRAALQLAQIELGRRHLSRAGELFQAARKMAPLPEDQARAAVGLAILAEEAREFDRAENLYSEALRLSPGLPHALERGANLLLFRNRPRQAIPLLEQLAAAAPESAAAHALLGRACLMAGDKPAARRALDRSLELDPNQPETRRLLQQAR